MNGKAARRQRALRRSQENNRLSRKAATVESTEAEHEFDRLMHKLREERAEAIKAAALVHKDAVDAADKERRKAVQRAEAEYLENRDKTIKKLAPKAAAA